MTTKADLQGIIDQMTGKLIDYQDVYLRMEVVIDALRRRNGALADIVITNIDKYDEPEMIQGLVDRALDGLHTTFNKTFKLVKAALMDNQEDLEHYTDLLKNDIPEYIAKMHEQAVKGAAAAERFAMARSAKADGDPED